MSVFETQRGLVEIRELSTQEDMAAAEKLQRMVWGADIWPHPKEMLIPVQHEGGLLAGAFLTSGEMVGMVFQFPTRDPATAHSQILAVVEDWRGEGIGRRMKWFQRDWCLQRGITCLRWTVDPLRAANAELNFHRLGAMSSTYFPDYYGPMQGIDSGAPSDRLLVEWHLESPRVTRLAQQGPDAPPADSGYPLARPAIAVNGNGVPNLVPEFAGQPVLISVPENFIHLAKADPALALAWRLETRALFLFAFQSGYLISGFTRVNGPAYLLEKETV